MKHDKDKDSLLKSAKDAFERAQQNEEENRRIGMEDLRFGRNGEQWPDEIRTQREKENRPILTINKLPAFIRQVVNDARQNKPAIKVHPVDSGADPATAEVINGLIRNIERSSKSDIAYDTAIECAVSNGFGYMRVGADYAYDDAFEMDITIDRVSNPFSVYGDPDSTSADGSDWDSAFIVERLSKAQFEKQYGDKAKVDWDNTAWAEAGNDWKNDDGVLVAEWWTREDKAEQIYKVSDGQEIRVYSQTQIDEDEDIAGLIQAGALEIVNQREVMRKKVTQHIMTGAEILETNDWSGRYIPIIPVYGDEFDIEGDRKLRSLIHNAIDAQKMHNFWRTASTELVALAPRVPYIGEEGAFDVDPNGWATANTNSHAYLEYSRGKQPPQRQPLDSGPAGGAIQEALMAADDMKSILGIHDASLGAKSNETSGRAILARQREGDVSTFHFIDNLSRSIRHLGNIILDLIPHFYNEERTIRVLGEDGKQKEKTVNSKTPQPELDENGEPLLDERQQAVIALHDLTVGKYDLTVSAGPSFTTRREEAAYQMTEALRNFQMAAPILLPMIAKNSDWPGADDLAEKLEALVPQQQDPNAMPPQAQMMMQQLQQAMEQARQQIQALGQENEQLKQDRSIKLAETEIKEYDAETKRMKVEAETNLKEVETELKIDQHLNPAPTDQGVQPYDY